MGEVEFTQEQKDAIYHPYSVPAVVTAAAGSGKTTLLVSRVIDLITDPGKDIPADSAAIMTFTVNATAHLNHKLRTALDDRIEKLENSPENETERKYLYEQKIALHNASISTINSFCLNILRENAEIFGLPINFTIANAPKKTAMQLNSIEAAMEEFYSDEPDSLFTSEERETLFYTFNFEDDNALKKCIIATAEKLSSYSDSEKWIENAVKAYTDINTLWDTYGEAFTEQVEFLQKMLTEIIEEYREIIDGYSLNLEDMELDLKNPDKPTITILGMREALESMEAFLSREEDRAESIGKVCSDYLTEPTMENLSAVSDCIACNLTNDSVISRKGSNDNKKKFTATKNRFQKTIENFADCCSIDKELEAQAIQTQQTAVSAFAKLLTRYMTIFSDTKIQQGSIDFSDCELLLLNKLRTDEAFRKSLASRFKCVIVDEFQDTNDVQAEIFRLIGEGHLFYVGDVKQSIYSFRGANPEIMAGLANNTESGFRTFPLNCNFRSRKPVIDTVNAAFSGLMTREYGGVDYENNNQLIAGAKFPEVSEENKSLYNTDIFLLSDKKDKKDKTDNDKNDNEDQELSQARFVARKIKELVNNENFLISNDMRRAEYSDFAVLLRTKKKIPLYKAALDELKIPAVTATGSNLLETEETSLLINLLKIIDNPYNDEAMLNLLMSPLYRFSANDMAQLRLGILGCIQTPPEDKVKPLSAYLHRKKLYSCLLFCGTPLEKNNEKSALSDRYDLFTGTDFRVSEKVTHILGDIGKFRKYMSSCSLSDLLERVIDETEIIPVFLAIDGSRRRVNNLRQIKAIAEDYEARENSSLSGFLRFLEIMSEEGIEETSAPDNSENAVRIMTFHASKGLEVPVCILAELNSRINLTDLRTTLIIDHDKYFSVKYVDRVHRFKAKTLSYNSLALVSRKKLVGDELRLLYVAMTRAQDKLIMVGKIPDSDISSEEANRLFPQKLFAEEIPFKWILGSLARYDRSPENGQFYGFDCRITNVELDSHRPEQNRDEAPDYSPDKEEVEKIVGLIQRKYVNIAETTQLSKQSVTELVHKTPPNMLNLSLPSFNEKKISGTVIGNAYHHAMEFFPLEIMRNAKASPIDLAAAGLDEIADRNFISAEERSFVKEEEIAGFFQSPLGIRMLNSSRVEREFSFTFPAVGEEIGMENAGEFIIKGQIDMFFIEEDGIVVVDYKTDSRKNLNEELENYRNQVRIYSKILPEFIGLPVKQMYIYSFSEGKEIEICQK